MVIILVGVLLWMANTFIPLPASVKNILNITVICILVFWLMKIMGLLDVVKDIRI